MSLTTEVVIVLHYLRMNSSSSSSSSSSGCGTNLELVFMRLCVPLLYTGITLISYVLF